MKTTKISIAFTFLLAFAFQVSAQPIEFPNELKDFEFYKRGKLTNIEPLKTTKQEIRAIFGDDCFFDGCSYDKDWDLRFMYYWEGFQISKYENGIKKNYVISPEYVDRIFMILLKPKKPLSLKQFTFPEKFKAYFGIGEHSVERKYFADSNGLYHSVSGGGADDEDNGNLTGVQYNVPENFKEERFILIQIENEPSSDQ